MENTFVVWDEQSREAAVIDPGMSNEVEELEIKSFIEENSLDIKYLINTHCHIDHILGCRFVKEKYNPVVLFKEGIGRTDLYGGDYNTLIESIKTKLFSLPDDILIYPGHGDESTIGYEKLHNPFLV